jgi:hypothetical protein
VATKDDDLILANTLCDAVAESGARQAIMGHIVGVAGFVTLPMLVTTSVDRKLATVSR